MFFPTVFNTHVGQHSTAEPEYSIYKHDILWLICIGLDQSGLEECGGRLVRTDHLD